MRYLKLKRVYINYNNLVEPTNDVIYLNEDKILLYQVEEDRTGRKYVTIETNVVYGNSIKTLDCDISALEQLNPDKECEFK